MPLHLGIAGGWLTDVVIAHSRKIVPWNTHQMSILFFQDKVCSKSTLNTEQWFVILNTNLKEKHLIEINFWVAEL